METQIPFCKNTYNIGVTVNCMEQMMHKLKHMLGMCDCDMMDKDGDEGGHDHEGHEDHGHEE